MRAKCMSPSTLRRQEFELLSSCSPGRGRIFTSAEGEWRNWQTRRIQDPVGFKTRGGSSPPSPTKTNQHNTDCQGLPCLFIFMLPLDVNFARRQSER